MITDYRDALIDISYLVAAVLFIFGLKRLSSPATARSGNRLAAYGMAIALLVTLLDRSIHWSAVNLLEIVLGTVLGAAIGVYFARTVQM
ncbi:MAG: NAD(P)(+) transhydrogenase (Re/Si-specific) subunit beta, partial [Thermomicrobiaceae bacterium]|nr:NAD(P)(+) transhydrogenase (Re/Si-specific) subunit beta [Thermomicrobiaceae bacterium]